MTPKLGNGRISLVDLRSRFERRVQLLQVYLSGSTRSVFIYYQDYFAFICLIYIFCVDSIIVIVIITW